MIHFSQPLTVGYRFQLESVQLLPDLFFYERRIERGYMVGDEFTTDLFMKSQITVYHDNDMRGFTPLIFGSAGLSSTTETGFVTREGLQAVIEAKMRPFAKGADPRIKDLVVPDEIDSNHFSSGRVHEAQHGNNLAAWRDGKLNAEQHLYRKVKITENGSWYVRYVDGVPLMQPVAVRFFVKPCHTEKPDDHKQFGFYDREALTAHLKNDDRMQQTEAWNTSVYYRWFPRDQAEFDIVWKALACNGGTAPTLAAALIQLDLLGIEQFKRSADSFIPDPPPIKTRLYSVKSTKKDETLVFAKSEKDALKRAVDAGKVKNMAAATVHDVSDNFGTHGPLKAMQAGLLGLASYQQGKVSGWASVNGKQRRFVAD